MPGQISYTWERYNWLNPFTNAPAPPFVPGAGYGIPANTPASIFPLTGTLQVTGTITATTLTVSGNASATNVAAAGFVSATNGLISGNGAAVSPGKIWGGSGVPAAGLGANGDFYFRTDTPGTASQRLYVKNAGAWAGIA